jgi:ATP-dependent Clp protease ATP-binding subunit ClpA
MFQTIQRRLQDVRTLAALCTRAEELARQEGCPQPASEHFVLAALALPDQTAARAFARLGLTESRFREALAAQRCDALASVGVTAAATVASDQPPAPVPPKPGAYQAAPSGQSLVQRLAETRTARAGRCLLGADVLLAAAQENHTFSSRAFRKLGIASSQLAEAARQSIDPAGR